MIADTDRPFQLADVTDTTETFDRVDTRTRSLGWAVLYSLVGGVVVGLAALAGLTLALPRDWV